MTENGQKNVLLIDDDSEYSAHVDSALSANGIAVFRVPDVTTALDKLSSGEFQVVIVDSKNENVSIKKRLQDLLPHLPTLKCIVHSLKFD